MLRIVLALVSLATVMGEGCCPPDVWEGLEGLLAGSVQAGKPHLTKGGLMLHLNNTGKIIAIEEDLFVDDHEIKLKIIQDYNRGTEYMIMDGKCTKKTLEPWKPKCIPDDAQVVQNTYFGAGSAMLAVKTYSFMEKGLQVYATATVSGCIPIVEVMSGTTAEGVSTVDVVEFSGITLGIKDPSVFNIPSICNSESVPFMHIPSTSRLRRSVFH
ncbi:hypothetical protein ACJMK2_034243 [Sinanodonta woodiana]|uniref:Uncharacterized protein n=1 Tax=Sinanodonta woodiana TaxID=1069815 RepID=A0ABD3WT43_SINWO